VESSWNALQTTEDHSHSMYAVDHSGCGDINNNYGLVVSCIILSEGLKGVNWLHEIEVVIVQSNDDGSSKGKALR
jgi:hypothetical protein